MSTYTLGIDIGSTTVKIAILDENEKLLFATKTGMVKIVAGAEFDVAKKTVAATKLNDGDELVSIVILNEQKNIVLQSKTGYFLRFAIEEIPEKKKNAIGVRGMKIDENDMIENVYYTQNGVDQVIKYKNKKVELNKIKLAKRDAKGTKIRV